MNIGIRIRRIREVKNLKQDAVAIDMKTSQQAYSCLEKQALPRMETILRFCNVAGIEPMFLISDIPISEESIAKYGKMKYSDIITKLNFYGLQQ